MGCVSVCGVVSVCKVCVCQWDGCLSVRCVSVSGVGVCLWNVCLSVGCVSVGCVVKNRIW